LVSQDINNEAELIARLVQGDEIAFRQIMKFYFPVIVNFSRRILGHDAAAEDVAAETFVKLWQNRSNLTSFQSMKAFLFISSKNSSLNELRSSQRADVRNTAYAAELESDTQFGEDAIIRAEAMALILQGSALLPEKIKRVFELGFLEGMPNREIARVLNVSVNTVKAQKARAVELLKEHFKEHHLLPAILILLDYFSNH
jgi:RNA polymerase sigma-70 factor (ECF subfamily)